MGLYNVFDIAGSGMSAQAVRLNSVASNLANADVVSGSPDTAYRARQPVFATVLDNAAGMAGAGPDGARVRVVGVRESLAPPRKTYAPNNPLADANGYVYHSNVNPIEQMANMISASRSYQSDVEMMNTSRQLLESTLRLGQ